MDAKRYLKDYIGRSSPVLDRFFDRKIKEVKNIGRKEKGLRVAVDMFSRYKEFVQGGKRLRGAYIQLGYELTGGNKKNILEASTCIEIIHGFLLMHDDIQDLDILRRGFPTVHKQYETEHKKLNIKKDHSHFGISMGINMGDLGAYLGTEILLNSILPEDRKLQAGIYLSRLLQKVAYGQGLDVTYEQLDDVTEKDILDVHLHKSAVYTVSGPLITGAILCGAASRKLAALENFGNPVGIAFQLRDDELGLFSDEKSLGKPIGSDIKEGKNTLLHIKAKEYSKVQDRKFLEWAYGNRNITKRDVKRVQEITTESGALKYSQELSRKLVEEGKEYIPKITKNSALQDTLASMADFMILRES